MWLHGSIARPSTTSELVSLSATKPAGMGAKTAARDAKKERVSNSLAIATCGCPSNTAARSDEPVRGQPMTCKKD
eukprot:scaffold170310_cov28-Tisochrysis_lutea.AAC.5